MVIIDVVVVRVMDGWMDTVDGWMDDLDYEQTHGYGTFLPDLAWPGRACLVCWPATAEREKERQRGRNLCSKSNLRFRSSSL